MENTYLIAKALARGILNYLGIPIEPIAPINHNEVPLKEAILNLHKHGIIGSPDYWLDNAVEGKTIKGEYAAILIKRVVAYFL